MFIFLSILAFVWGYKKSKRTGRNAWLWSLICGFTFLGTQLLITIALAGVVAVGVTFFDWREDLLDRSYYPIGLVALIAGIIALQVMFYYLDRPPQVSTFTEPPEPPRFNGQ